MLFDAARDWATALRRHLRERTNLDVRLNQPYAVTPEEDYTAYVHGADRGLAALLIEVRNDLLDGPQDFSRLARQMADALEATLALAQPNS